MSFWLVLLGVFLLDQFSKWLIQANLNYGQSIQVIPGIFSLTYIQNPGVAFGLLAYKNKFFVLITMVLLAGIAGLYRKIKKTPYLLQLALGLITGGALGNLLDRLRFGKVIDFLDFHFWPVFNFADSAIVIGTGLIMLNLLIRPLKKD